MNRNLGPLIALVSATVLGAACTASSRTEFVAPTAPTPVPAAAPAPTSSTSPFLGTWASANLTAPSAGSCTNFQWQVTSATSNSLAGTFSATCGLITVIGTASGRIEGSTVPLAVAGTATYAGAVSCDFSLSGTGLIEDSNTLTIPYSGTTCLGPLSGTERLTRPTQSQPAPEPPAPPPPAPVDPLFGCGGIPDREQLVECIWGHIRPTDHNSAFEVTKRVAWALRGEGAGLLIKNGGENITAWRGYLFSSSRICYPDGRLVKVIYDAGPGGANGPSWQDPDDYVDPGRYVPAMDPSLP